MEIGMKNRLKLELTWIGKDKRLNLEPRILIEDPERSYGDKNSENMLVFGDNLLALKALEQDRIILEMRLSIMMTGWNIHFG
jgi:hypothetical protein